MKVLQSLAVLSAALFVAACDSDNNNRNNADPEFFKLQVLHASPDAPNVNVFLDGTEALSNVAFGESSPLLSLEARPGLPYTVRVDAILPGGTATVIGPVDIDFAADTIYTIAAVNDVANIEPAVITQPDVPVSAGSARLFVLHGAAAAPAVDVFVTAPGADLAASAPVGTFSFKESIGPAEVAAGEYQVRVTAAGDPAAVVFDSGTITLNDGDDLTLTAVPSTTSTISLLAQTGEGAIEILDASTPTFLQVVHASPDAPNVDVVVNGDVLIPDLPFPAATGVLGVPSATYNVAVTVADNPGAVAIGPVDLDLAAGTRYSVLAVGELANIEPLILTDDPRRIATNARVRLVHASPTAQDVDIYVTAVGADIANESPTFPGVPFKGNTGFVNLAAGEYDVTITPAGSKTAAIGPLTIAVENNGVYTAIARDPLPGSTELGVILTDDFAL